MEGRSGYKELPQTLNWLFQIALSLTQFPFLAPIGIKKKAFTCHHAAISVFRCRNIVWPSVLLLFQIAFCMKLIRFGFVLSDQCTYLHGLCGKLEIRILLYFYQNLFALLVHQLASLMTDYSIWAADVCSYRIIKKLWAGFSKQCVFYLTSYLRCAAMSWYVCSFDDDLNKWFQYLILL